MNHTRVRHEIYMYSANDAFIICQALQAIATYLHEEEKRLALYAYDQKWQCEKKKNYSLAKLFFRPTNSLLTHH